MSTIFEKHFQAWSCTFSLELIESNCDSEHIVAEIKDHLDTYEKTFSRFKPESLVSQLNNGKSIIPTPLFESVLSVATDLSKKLDNSCFNPHIDLEAYGYSQSIETQNFTKANPKLSPLPKFPEGLERQGNKLQLKPGSCIDFGSFLKGYLSEQIAEKYKNCARGIIVNFGGDISVRGRDVHSKNFDMGIFNPITHQDEIILLNNQSLSTSGTYKRRWHIEGEDHHHILDPKTHTSSESEFVSISFWGSNGALCDALATASFNTNSETWESWKNKFKSIEYLAIKPSGGVISSVPLTS